MGPRHDLSFCACTTACIAPELLVSMGPSLHLWFNLRTRITSLYGFQTSPVVLCIANHAVFHAQSDRLCLGSIETCYSVPKIAVLYKRGTLVPDLHVSMGPSPHLWFCAFKGATLRPELHVSMGRFVHC